MRAGPWHIWPIQTVGLEREVLGKDIKESGRSPILSASAHARAPLAWLVLLPPGIARPHQGQQRAELNKRPKKKMATSTVKCERPRQSNDGGDGDPYGAPPAVPCMARSASSFFSEN